MSLNTTPRTWVSGEVVTAAELNAEIRDAIVGVQAAWTAYTPTLTNITLGNGTLNFAWSRIGHTIFARGQFVAGSTTTYSAGTLALSLPTTPIAAITTVGGYPIGTGIIQNSGSATRAGCTALVTTAGTVNFMLDNSAANTLINNATPGAWSTSGMISLNAMYESA